MREFLKDRAEPLLAALAWRFRSPHVRTGTLVLAYHNIRPAGEAAAGEHALHLPWAQFCEHLDLLAGHAEIVSLASTSTPGHSHNRPRVALTFDDAYAGAVEFALPEVSRRGLTASMFVAPGLLGGRSFWWDQLAGPLGGVLPADVRGFALETLAGRQDRVAAWAAERRLPWTESMPAWAVGASAAALRSAASLPGITIGAHSWSHPNLAALTGEALTQELQAPRQWMREQGLGTGDWLAYPYGRAGADTAQAAEAAGYVGALRVSGGFVRADVHRHQLPRLNVPAQLSGAGLRLRLAGWLAA
jgi:peptidoglycan/xylan/chitin deacetylase (PgdA/CDA1 family)